MGISALCSLTYTHPLPPTPLTCVLTSLWGLGVVEDEEEEEERVVGCVGRADSFSSSSLPSFGPVRQAARE